MYTAASVATRSQSIAPRRRIRSILSSMMFSAIVAFGMTWISWLTSLMPRAIASP